MNDVESSQLKTICSLQIKNFSGAFIRINCGFYSEEVSNRQVLAWLEKGNDLSRVERTMNHLHVRDTFMSMTDNEYDNIAVAIFLEWNRILKEIDSYFRVIKFEDLGPVVSFFKIRQ